MVASTSGMSLRRRLVATPSDHDERLLEAAAVALTDVPGVAREPATSPLWPTPRTGSVAIGRVGRARGALSGASSSRTWRSHIAKRGVAVEPVRDDL
jgi:hypothetical protein